MSQVPAREHPDSLDGIVDGILDSYRELGGINHIEGANLPSRQSVERIVEELASLIFPGFRTEERLELTGHALCNRGKGREPSRAPFPSRWKRACATRAG